jgi:hypothetical protein
MFIELTRTNNEKVTVIISNIAYVTEGNINVEMNFVTEDSIRPIETVVVNKSKDEYSVIHFVNGEHINCKESYAYLKKILASHNK